MIVRPGLIYGETKAKKNDIWWIMTWQYEGYVAQEKEDHREQTNKQPKTNHATHIVHNLQYYNIYIYI